MEGLLILSHREFGVVPWMTPGRVVAALRHEWYAKLDSEERRGLVQRGRWRYCIVEVAEEPKATLSTRVQAADDLIARASLQKLPVIYIRHMAVRDGGLDRNLLRLADALPHRVLSIQGTTADPYMAVYRELFDLEAGRDMIRFLDDIMAYHESMVSDQKDEDGKRPAWIVYGMIPREEILNPVTILNTLHRPIWVCAPDDDICIEPGKKYRPELSHYCHYYQIENSGISPDYGEIRPLLYDAARDCYVPALGVTSVKTAAETGVTPGE